MEVDLNVSANKGSEKLRTNKNTVTSGKLIIAIYV
jgi:hypothetical protein